MGVPVKGRVLIVAGSDSSGGTGIQADLKTVTVLGGYAMTAITALTARDTQGVIETLPVPATFVQRQMRLALEDIGADVIMCGMLYDAASINAVADVIEELAPDTPLVLDPIMVAKSGRSLLDHEGLRHMKIRLLPRATILTPNLREAELLAGMEIADIDQRSHAASMMLTLGAKSVLLKGGHGNENPVVDLLATEDATTILTNELIETRHTAGLGSSLSAAIAVSLAQGMDITSSVLRAREFVQRCLKAAPGFGLGTGPISHAITLEPFQVAQPAE